MKTITIFLIFVTAVISSPVRNLNWDILKQDDHFSTKPVPEVRITGGLIAAPHQFPYQVGLFLQSYTILGIAEYGWCGASLISSKVVLTAAHCLYEISGAIVLLGAHNIANNNIGKISEGVDSTNFIIHEEYNPNFSENDIGLIVLPKEIIFNEYIQPVNLPQPGQDQSALETKVATVTGWGATGDREDLSKDLRYANLRVLPASKCERTYPYLFYPTHICVSGENHKSVCVGDSGGPLVVKGSAGDDVVVGLVSFGRRQGCQLGYPTVFTRITSYLDWIADKAGIKPKGFTKNIETEFLL